MNHLTAALRRRPRLSWFALPAASWVTLNLIALPEHIRLLSLPITKAAGLHTQAIVSIVLPFSAIQAGWLGLSPVLIILWPVAALLWWKWLRDDWSARRTALITVVGVLIPLVSGAAVASVEIRADRLEPVAISSVVLPALALCAYVTMWNIATSHAHRVLSSTSDSRSEGHRALRFWMPVGLYSFLNVGSLALMELPRINVGAQIVAWIIAPFVLILTSDAQSASTNLPEDLAYGALSACVASLGYILLLDYVLWDSTVQSLVTISAAYLISYGVRTATRRLGVSSATNDV